VVLARDGWDAVSEVPAESGVGVGFDEAGVAPPTDDEVVAHGQAERRDQVLGLFDRIEVLADDVESLSWAVTVCEPGLVRSADDERIGQVRRAQAAGAVEVAVEERDGTQSVVVVDERDGESARGVTRAEERSQDRGGVGVRAHVLAAVIVESRGGRDGDADDGDLDAAACVCAAHLWCPP
jgi:hypothetical protein